MEIGCGLKGNAPWIDLQFGQVGIRHVGILGCTGAGLGGKSHSLGPVGSGFDPGLQDRDLVRGERFTVGLLTEGRHEVVVVGCEYDALKQLGFVWLASDQGLSRFPAFQRQFMCVEAQLALVLAAIVAFEAVLLEDGPNLFEFPGGGRCFVCRQGDEAQAGNPAGKDRCEEQLHSFRISWRSCSGGGVAQAVRGAS